MGWTIKNPVVLLGIIMVTGIILFQLGKGFFGPDTSINPEMPKPVQTPETVSLETTTTAPAPGLYECENGVKFWLEIVNPMSIGMTIDKREQVILSKETDENGVLIYGDDANALTFSSGYGRQVIKTRREGPYSTICNQISDTQSVGHIEPEAHERIWRIVKSTDANDDYVVKVLDNNYFLSNSSPAYDGGQELTGFIKNKDVYKMFYSAGLSRGFITYLFYFDKEELVYVYEEENTFPYIETKGEFNYETAETVYSAGHFFVDGKWTITKYTGTRRLSDTSEQDRAKELLVMAEKFTGLLK